MNPILRLILQKTGLEPKQRERRQLKSLILKFRPCRSGVKHGRNVRSSGRLKMRLYGSQAEHKLGLDVYRPSPKGSKHIREQWLGPTPLINTRHHSRCATSVNTVYTDLTRKFL